MVPTNKWNKYWVVLCTKSQGAFATYILAIIFESASPKFSDTDTPVPIYYAKVQGTYCI